MKALNEFQAILRQVLRLSVMRFDAAERYPPVWAAILGGAGSIVLDNIGFSRISRDFLIANGSDK